MPRRISNRLIQKNQWRILGFFSSIIGFTSYAFSSSFNHLFGKWNFIKIIIYTVVSFSISSMMLFLKKWKLSRRFLLRAHLGVLVLLLTSLYSFVSDKASNEKPDLLSMISCVAFALMSFCLSRQIDIGFESDLLNFFLGILTVQLMKINLILSLVAAILCYSLIVLRSKLGSRHEIGTSRVQDDVAIEINGVDNDRNEFQSDYSNGSQQNQSLIRRMNHDDGYNWKKYEDKVAKGSENQRSYYKCTWPNCLVKKKVERTIDGEVIETLYKGTHNHWKPTSSMKRNSSSEYLYSLLPSEIGPIDLQDQSFGSEQLDSDEEPAKSSVSI